MEVIVRQIKVYLVSLALSILSILIPWKIGYLPAEEFQFFFVALLSFFMPIFIIMKYIKVMKMRIILILLTPGPYYLFLTLYLIIGRWYEFS